MKQAFPVFVGGGGGGGARQHGISFKQIIQNIHFYVNARTLLCMFSLSQYIF